MKVKMLSIAAGPNGSYRPKDVVDFPTAQAKDLIAGGFAVAMPAAARVTKKLIQTPVEELASKEIDPEDLEEDEDKKEKR